MDAVVISESGGMRDFVREHLPEGWRCTELWDDALLHVEERKPHLLFVDWRCLDAWALVDWSSTRREVRCMVFLEEGETEALDQLAEAGGDVWIWWSVEADAPARPDASARVRFFVKRFERALQEYHEKLKLARVAELTSDSVEIADPEVFWEYLNPAFTAITGYTAEEAVGHSPRQLLFSGLHGEEHFRDIHEAVTREQLWRGGHISRRKDGTLSFQENTIAWVCSERGDQIGTVGLKRDLFHSRFADERPVSSNNSLRDWMQEATEALFLFDVDERLIDANMTACQLLGYPLGELTRLSLGALDMQCQPGQISAWFETQEPGTSFTHSSWFCRKDGSTFAGHMRMCVLRFGNAMFLAASMQDVTALKQTQRRLELLNQELQDAKNAAIEASRAKSLFLASMSHELRTPLNAVIGYTQLLSEELSDDGRQGYLPDLRKIEISASHLLSLINDILDLSKIEANKLELSYDQIDLQELLNEVTNTMESLAMKNCNSLRWECDTARQSIFADRLRLRQILLNLLGNACKFTEDGKIELRVFTEHDDGREFVAFAVKDNGVGIAADQQKKLLEPFSQGAARTGVIQQRGSGLGLAITKRLCQAMGGALRFESALGKGSTFVARLPIAPPVSHEESSPRNMG